MSDDGKRKPDAHKRRKPPYGKWRATKPFFDLKLSHWVSIILTLSLIYVGTSQLIVYRRQAGIMGTQAEITRQQLSEMREEQRAWIAPTSVKLISPQNDATFVNIGHVPAHYLFDKQANIIPIDRITASRPDYTLGDTDKIYIDTNMSCPIPDEMQHQAIVYPSSAPYSNVGFSSSKDDAIAQIQVANMDKIMKGEVIFYFNACFTYVSGDDVTNVHQSQFCEYLILRDPNANGMPTFKLCPTGQSAN